MLENRTDEWRKLSQSLSGFNYSGSGCRDFLNCGFSARLSGSSCSEWMTCALLSPYLNLPAGAGAGLGQPRAPVWGWFQAQQRTFVAAGAGREEGEGGRIQSWQRCWDMSRAWDLLSGQILHLSCPKREVWVLEQILGVLCPVFGGSGFRLLQPVLSALIHG